MTFAPDPAVVEPVSAMMAGSREAVVDYMTPLGLAHLMATGHHYGPGPWIDDLARPEWNPVYYHQASRQGIGFERNASGSDAISQYAPAVARQLESVGTTPERNLLWFHHLPWDYRMRSGRTLWEELVSHYDRGVDYVGEMQRRWASLKPLIDRERFQKTATLLRVQAREAKWWRDASLAYWMSVNGLSMPAGARPPEHDLSWYKKQSWPDAPGH